MERAGSAHPRRAERRDHEPPAGHGGRLKNKILGSAGLLGLVLIAATGAFAAFEMFRVAAVCFGLGGVLVLGSALTVVFTAPKS